VQIVTRKHSLLFLTLSISFSMSINAKSQTNLAPTKKLEVVDIIDSPLPASDEDIEAVRPAKTSSNKIDLVSSDDEDGGGSRGVNGFVDLVADDDEGCEGDGLLAVVSDEDIQLFDTVSGA
jgi:hypothetical protein